MHEISNPFTPRVLEELMRPSSPTAFSKAPEYLASKSLNREKQSSILTPPSSLKIYTAPLVKAPHTDTSL